MTYKNATEVRKAIKISERERDTNPCPAYKARCTQHIGSLMLLLRAHEM